MRTLGSVARRPQEAGEFLPAVFTALENAGIRLRDSTVTFIAGVAGSMKTGLALYWVGRWNRPTLYFSADSEPFEIFERAAAMVSGDTMNKVRQNMPAYEAAVNGLNIRFVFEDSPTYKDVELEVGAYAEVYGEWPKVIVIDNLLNLVGDNENEWGAHRDSARVVHRLARITKAKVLVLAHMGESVKDPSSQPPPRTMLQGKVSHLPKVILSLAFDGQRLKVAPVKNRFGPGDASGSTFVELYCDPSTNRFFNSKADQQMGRPA
jgi:hypothetical protein